MKKSFLCRANHNCFHQNPLICVLGKNKAVATPPPFFSIEITEGKMHKVLPDLVQMGYTRFKLVMQNMFCWLEFE